MGGLIERTAEMSAVEELLGQARAGAGRSLLVTGPAGIGRTALAGRAGEAAQSAGFTVLSSCPTPVSPDLPHGLVLDWLGQLVRAGRPGAAPFDGPAAELAEAMATPSPGHPVWNLAALDYALTWALESLATSRPLLLVVDDLQWLDVVSLQLLDLLSARLPLMPVGLLLTARSGDPTEHPDIVERVAARARRVQPAPLSVAGVDQARREVAAPRLADVSAADLHHVTGGLPFLVHELLRAGTLDEPPREVVDSVRERLARLGPEAVTVATTAAALGEQAKFDALAELTGLTVAGLADPLELLTAADVLEVGLWRARPRYPVVAEAILAGMSPSERSDLHRRAAACLAGQGASRQVVADHLVHTLPDEDPAVVDLLRTAGQESLRAGEPAVAARHLLRAVYETRPQDTGCDLLALAASAHLLAGLQAEAFDLWSRALDRAPDPSTRAALLADIGEVRMTLGARSEAKDTYRQAIEALADAGHGSSSAQMRNLEVRAALARALCDGPPAEVPRAAAVPASTPVEDETLTDRLRLALTAFDLALRGEDRTTARDLARRALAGGSLLAEETAGGMGFCVASSVLSWADAYDEQLPALDAAVEEARRRGSVLDVATASYCRGLAHFRLGRLRLASGGFQAALGLRARGWSDFGEPAVAGAALTCVALGEYDEALALEPALRAAAGRGDLLSAQTLAAAGLLRAAHGDHVQALEDYHRAASLMGPHPDNGSVVEWREFSVWSLKALGRREEALDVAEEALRNARRWGAPRGLGFALRALAQLTPRDRSMQLLREAIGHFDAVGTLDYRARAWTDLGRLLLAGGRDERDEGVTLLRRVLDHGRRDDVPSAVVRATRLLVRAGETVSDPAADPAGSLTPGERRVAELAAAGATNRQIAEKLFVTVKAVEWHLSNAYRKLAISSRAELAAALYGEAGASSSSAM